MNAAIAPRRERVATKRGGIMSSEKWHLFDRATRQQVSELTLSEVVEKLGAVGPEARSGWYAWRAGFADWTPVRNCPEILRALGAKNPPSLVPPPPPTPLFTNAGWTENRRQERVERRKHPRFQIRLKVVVLSDTRTFRSFTRDASLGGLLLEHKLPAWVSSSPNCRILISSPAGDRTIGFVARVLPDTANMRRLAFLTSDAETESELAGWLESISDAMKRIA